MLHDAVGEFEQMVRETWTRRKTVRFNHPYFGAISFTGAPTRRRAHTTSRGGVGESSPLVALRPRRRLQFIHVHRPASSRASLPRPHRSGRASRARISGRATSFYIRQRPVSRRAAVFFHTQHSHVQNRTAQ
jgi:hypothetical protein